MLHLMNSAMMPRPGAYLCVAIGPEQAVAFFSRLRQRNVPWRSYIGYAQNAQYLGALLGVRIPVNRDPTELESGDWLLMMRLRYRVSDPAGKGAPVNPDDFELFAGVYADTPGHLAELEPELRALLARP